MNIFPVTWKQGPAQVGQWDDATELISRLAISSSPFIPPPSVLYSPFCSPDASAGVNCLQIIVKKINPSENDFERLLQSWFQAAEAKLKSDRSCLFVAWLTSRVLRFAGEDEQSTEMAARWEDEKVTEAASDGFVAIKIDTKRFDPILILFLTWSSFDDDESRRLLKSCPWFESSLNSMFQSLSEFSAPEATAVRENSKFPGFLLQCAEYSLCISCWISVLEY